MRAENFGNGEAWFRHEITRREALARRTREAPARSGRAIASQQQTQRGVANRAGDHHAIACFGAGASQHLALRHGAERRN